MTSDALFEFHYRWDQLAGDLANKEDELEARDAALEQFIRDFSCGSGLGSVEYPYRWQQILIQTDVPSQIQMLEERERALEDFFYRGGVCPLELPFRWDQIWEGLAAGEAWAVACAEENDRAIEALFANCSCGGGATFVSWVTRAFDSPADEIGQSYTVTSAGTIVDLTYDLSFIENIESIYYEVSIAIYVNGDLYFAAATNYPGTSEIDFPMDIPIVPGDLIRCEIVGMDFGGLTQYLLDIGGGLGLTLELSGGSPSAIMDWEP